MKTITLDIDIRTEDLDSNAIDLEKETKEVVDLICSRWNVAGVGLHNVCEYDIVRDKEKGFGLVRTTPKRKISKLLGWFDSFEQADSERTKITGKVQTIIL